MQGEAAAARAPRLDERAAVEGARHGDRAAFARLVERYAQPVVSLCYASLLDPDDAEDLAQEVFLAAWRGLPRFRGDASFSTWLFALARNACVDRARRSAARPRLVPQDDGIAAPDRYDEATQRTAHEILAAAAALSPPLRQALLLRDLQGLSYEDIAALQDVPLGTVRSRIAAARAAVTRQVRG